MEKPDVSPGFPSGPLRGCASLAVMATQSSKREPNFHKRFQLNYFRQSVEDLISQSEAELRLRSAPHSCVHTWL